MIILSYISDLIDVRYPYKSRARVALGQRLRDLQLILSDRIGLDLGRFKILSDLE